MLSIVMQSIVRNEMGEGAGRPGRAVPDPAVLS